MAMKAAEKKKFLKLLEESKAQLISDMEKTNENVVSQGLAEGDLVDVASDSWERMINMGISSQELHELKEVEHAIRKITDKNYAPKPYGMCEDCDDAIAAPRLEALPAARRCVKCQEIFDKASKVNSAR